MTEELKVKYKYSNGREFEAVIEKVHEDQTVGDLLVDLGRKDGEKFRVLGAKQDQDPGHYSGGYVDESTAERLNAAGIDGELDNPEEDQQESNSNE